MYSYIHTEHRGREGRREGGERERMRESALLCVVAEKIGDDPEAAVFNSPF